MDLRKGQAHGTVWRGSLDHIQTWKRPRVDPCQLEPSKRVSGIVGGNFKLSAPKSEPKLQQSGQVSASMAPQAYVFLDRERMIDMCEREVSTIVKEFALLERTDFVDLIRSETAKFAGELNNQDFKSKVFEKASGSVVNPEDHKMDKDEPSEHHRG